MTTPDRLFPRTVFLYTVFETPRFTTIPSPPLVSMLLKETSFQSAPGLSMKTPVPALPATRFPLTKLLYEHSTSTPIPFGRAIPASSMPIRLSQILLDRETPNKNTPCTLLSVITLPTTEFPTPPAIDTPTWFERMTLLSTLTFETWLREMPPTTRPVTKLFEAPVEKARLAPLM